ncbi:MAG: transcriptional repressor [Firmicutes bacterium]|jgi:Fe2+ or Zn2+ uptake regulation protein|nr:transcriptional repressor [Bacillota bacterium]
MKIEDVLELIRKEGYKVTNQRKAIIQVLIENRDFLLSAEELLEKSKLIYPKTNMSTIYRNIEILSNANILFSDIDKNNIAIYKLICSNNHHHHLICKSCGRTEAIDYCPIKAIEEITKEKNYILLDHKFEIYGYCEDCQNKGT